MKRYLRARPSPKRNLSLKRYLPARPSPKRNLSLKRYLPARPSARRNLSLKRSLPARPSPKRNLNSRGTCRPGGAVAGTPSRTPSRTPATPKVARPARDRLPLTGRGEGPASRCRGRHDPGRLPRQGLRASRRRARARGDPCALPRHARGAPALSRGLLAEGQRFEPSRSTRPSGRVTRPAGRRRRSRCSFSVPGSADPSELLSPATLRALLHARSGTSGALSW